MGASMAPDCSCSDKCCGDEIRGQACGKTAPGMPLSSPAFEVQEEVALPKQVMAAEMQQDVQAVKAAFCGREESPPRRPGLEAVPTPATSGSASARVAVVERRWGTPAKSGLELGFLLPDGAFKHVAFGDALPPLGIDFLPGKPCKTKAVKPGSHAERLGVKEGWIVQYVNGQRVVGEEVDYIFELMTRALKSAARGQGSNSSTEAAEVDMLPEAVLRAAERCHGGCGYEEPRQDAQFGPREAQFGPKDEVMRRQELGAGRPGEEFRHRQEEEAKGSEDEDAKGSEVSA